MLCALRSIQSVGMRYDIDADILTPTLTHFLATVCSLLTLTGACCVATIQSQVLTVLQWSNVPLPNVLRTSRMGSIGFLPC